MRTGPAKLVLLLLCGGLLSAPTLLAKKKQEAAKPVPIEQRRAVHALNRLTFGPRPGDVQQVMSVGVEKWIDLQLHPDKIADSPTDSRLASFRTLHMSSKELAENFPDNQVIREVMDGKRSMPSDAARRAVYRVQIARMQDKKERRSEIATSKAVPLSNPGNSAVPEESSSTSAHAVTSGNASRTMENEVAPTETPAAESTTPGSELQPPTADDLAARRREERLYADIAIQSVFDLPPHERYQKVLGMPVDQQLALADSLRGDKAQEFIAGMEAQQQETILALLRNPQAVVADELAQAKILRALYSERQLEEVMTDFWFNHFNVYMNKGADRLLVTSYEQETIRPRALGNFENLLIATAKSPAMLFYLDNWLSVGPESAKALGLANRPRRPSGPYGRPRRIPPNQQKAKRKQNSGLNENYGRELLELHTLSVNGGYSQRDVTEVAKVFSGWTIDKPFAGGEFRFDPLMHEPGPKFVMGHRIKPKGEDEGREVLHRLATSPQTAHFISLKLAERFISDDPPPALVDRMARTFLKKKGDIRAVLSELFHSPEFWAEDTYRAKVKTPLEYVASAVRSTGAEVDDAAPLVRQVSDMGMPLYAAQPPTGYSMKAETWVGSSALLNRMNFALSLAAGRVRGVKVDAAQIVGSSSIPADPTMTLSAMEVGLFGGDVSRQTHESIVAQIEASERNTPGEGKRKSDPRKAEAGPPDASVIAGLLLGSPEFQRR